uniref:Uncharacterized protein n=1 Tax=Nicotiana tabacum TaxID=4097 RepID=A0A1S3ZUH3_TOBAC|nr:PREDICTED: uncharacterized protein LOC107790628 [Nicotiana tabacum]
MNYSYVSRKILGSKEIILICHAAKLISSQRTKVAQLATHTKEGSLNDSNFLDTGKGGTHVQKKKEIFQAAQNKQGKVRQKLSSGGKYVSVNIGPIQVVSSEQVQAVYNAMRKDDRMKYFL